MSKEKKSKSSDKSGKSGKKKSEETSTGVFSGAAAVSTPAPEVNPVDAFNRYRSRMNERLTGEGNKVLNRLFNLDTNAYMDGALSAETKEMLGLVASMVLRCDDCIRYHLGKCREAGISTEQIMEIFAVANIVGGTIVIPHTRRALEYWDALGENSQTV